MYAHIWRNEDGTWEGQTYGCGCCSDTENVTLEDIKAHIASLEEDLSKAKEALADLDR